MGKPPYRSMKIIIIPAECPYIGCDFTNRERGIASKNAVIKHIEEIHQ